MYLDFYGLSEQPFNLTPDTGFLFPSMVHREVLAHLLYGVNTRKGFIMVTGEVGSGKTTLCRALLTKLGPDTEVALVLNSFLSELELLETINQDLGIQSGKVTRKELIDELNDFLLDRRMKGKNVVLIIDEAQNLSFPVLEQIRMLSNLETEKEKLLQIVLVGQPELRRVLGSPRLRQLNQRITVRHHITPLTKKETIQYIYHRLRIAGSSGNIVFTDSALNEIYRFSRGIPRMINVICEQTLLAGYVANSMKIDRKMVRAAQTEIEGVGKQPGGFGRREFSLVRVGAGVGLIVAACLIALTVFRPAVERALLPTDTSRTAAAARRGTQPVPGLLTAKAERTPPRAATREGGTQGEAPKGASAPAVHRSGTPADRLPQVVAEASHEAGVESGVEDGETPAGAPAGKAEARSPEVTARQPSGATQVEEESPRHAAAGAPPPSLMRLAFLSGATSRLGQTLSDMSSSDMQFLFSPERRTLSTLPPRPKVEPLKPARVPETAVRSVVAYRSFVEPMFSLLRLWKRTPAAVQAVRKRYEEVGEHLPSLAAAAGMGWVSLRANLETLRTIDMPAIVEVTGQAEEQKGYVALAAIGETWAEVVTAEGRKKIGIQLFSEIYAGSAIILCGDGLVNPTPLRQGQGISLGVRKLQDYMRQAGYFDGSASGWFTPATTAAVMAFQRDQGLAATGEADGRTKLLLYASQGRPEVPHLCATD